MSNKLKRVSSRSTVRVSDGECPCGVEMGQAHCSLGVLKSGQMNRGTLSLGALETWAGGPSSSVKHSQFYYMI